MQYFDINGYTIPYPNDFTMRKVPNIVNELTTLTGKVVADVNGWRYDDTTLSWDTLIDDDLQNLLDAVSTGEFTITYTDVIGSTVSVNAVLRSRAEVKTPIITSNGTLWKEIEISVMFPDCYGA